MTVIGRAQMTTLSQTQIFLSLPHLRLFTNLPSLLSAAQRLWSKILQHLVVVVVQFESADDHAWFLAYNGLGRSG